MAGVQFIDRRKCHRTVPLQVLGFGAGRTGTESLRQALIQLGFIETYHGFAASFESPRDCEMWYDALNAKYNGQGKPFGRKEWDQLLGHCQAVIESPAHCFAEELVEAYPEAKVILTNRDVDLWYESFRPSHIDTTYTFPGRALAFIHNLHKTAYSKVFPVFTIVLESFWGASNPFAGDPTIVQQNEKRVKATYIAHYENVRRIVPKERLLEFKVQDGWGPLCEFLGVETPDTPFPKGNDLKALRQRQVSFMVESLKVVGLDLVIPVSLVVFIGYMTSRWYSHTS